MRLALVVVGVAVLALSCGDRRRARARDDEPKSGAAPGAAASGAGPAAPFGGLLARRRSAPALPLPEGELPILTRWVARSFYREMTAMTLVLRPEDVPDEALGSFYAGMFCGLGDPFASLLGLRAPQQRDVALHTLQHLDEARRALACGRALADKARGEPAPTILFYGSRTVGFLARLDIVPLEAAPEPASERFQAMPFQSPQGGANLDGARCLVAPRASSCGSPASGFAHLTGTPLWLVGSAAELAVFGLGYTRNQGVRPEEGKRMVELATSLDASLPFLQVGDFETFGSSFGAASWFGMAPLPSTEAAFLVRLVEEERAAWGVERTQAVFGTVKLALLAGTEDGAARLEKALDAWRARAVVEAAKDPPAPALPPGTPPPLPEEKAADEGVVRAQRASAAKAKVTRSGKRVELQVEVRPTDADTKVVGELHDKRRVLATRAAEVVRALAEGKAPSPEALEALGGKDLAQAGRPGP